jgi:hypothetical protein
MRVYRIYFSDGRFVKVRANMELDTLFKEIRSKAYYRLGKRAIFLNDSSYAIKGVKDLGALTDDTIQDIQELTF